MTTHTNCDHDSTKSARAACRKLRAQGVDTTLGTIDLAANRVHRANPDHSHNCAWHAVMAVAENWDYSRDVEHNPSFAGDVTMHTLLENAPDLLDTNCQCD